MGLDFLKRKEDTAKELYSEFSKSMISNVYNSESLKSDIQTYKDNIQLMTNENVKLQKDPPKMQIPQKKHEILIFGG
jgi:hypothetical protein